MCSGHRVLFCTNSGHIISTCFRVTGIHTASCSDMLHQHSLQCTLVWRPVSSLVYNSLLQLVLWRTAQLDLQSMVGYCQVESPLVLALGPLVNTSGGTRSAWPGNGSDKGILKSFTEHIMQQVHHSACHKSHKVLQAYFKWYRGTFASGSRRDQLRNQ